MSYRIGGMCPMSRGAGPASRRIQAQGDRADGGWTTVRTITSSLCCSSTH